MLDLVLVLEAAGIGTRRPERRDEDIRRGAECLELFRPLGRVVGDEGGELGLGSAGGGLWGTAGDGIDPAHAGAGEEAGEDVGALRSAFVWCLVGVLLPLLTSFSKGEQ